MTKEIMYAGENIAGKRYGMLVVVRSLGRNKYRMLVVECICDCGGRKDIRLNNLMNGTKSCGCLRVKALVARSRALFFKHGHTVDDKGKRKNSPEYRVWRRIKDRCYNENQVDYKNYGGQGIEVCDRWRGPNCFPNFLEDMGFRPSSFYYFTRIDRGKNFSKENCEWRHGDLPLRNYRKSR